MIKIYDKVISLYPMYGISDIAKICNISNVKVRRILITEGLWKSRRSLEIETLLNQGYSKEDISNKLSLSIKAVEAYMPYKRGYYDDELSDNALYIKQKREKENKLLNNQVTLNRNNLSDTIDNNCNIIYELKIKLKTDGISEEDNNILKKYGQVVNDISRKILVNSSITLYQLHYIIMRLFGFYNSHLHKFSLPENVFNMITNDKYKIWRMLVGYLFRVPSEEFDEIYFDDDYSGGSFKNWCKSKYRSNHNQLGIFDQYITQQQKLVQYGINNVEQIMCFKEGKKIYKKTDECLISEIYMGMDIYSNALIERLKLSDILGLNPNINVGDMINELTKVNLRIKNEFNGENIKDEAKYIEYIKEFNPKLTPITNKIDYEYDFGDGWKFEIELVDVFNVSDRDKLKEVQMFPKCIELDGKNLIDDVGGIRGYINFLKEINKNTEEGKSYKLWASSIWKDKLPNKNTIL